MKCSRWPHEMNCDDFGLLDLFQDRVQTYRLTSDTQCKLNHDYAEWLTQCKSRCKCTPVLNSGSASLWSWSNITRVTRLKYDCCLHMMFSHLQTTANVRKHSRYWYACMQLQCHTWTVYSTIACITPCIITCSGSTQTM